MEYALRDVNKPMGVSSFIGKDIPLSVRSQLPSVEEIEQELRPKENQDKDLPLERRQTHSRRDPFEGWEK